MDHDQTSRLDQVRAAAADQDRPTGALLDALRDVPAAHDEVDLIERQLLEALMDRGLGWDAIAAELGARSGDALRVRYRRLGGKKNWPTGPRRAAE
ncbi:SANT/Myb-like DNA-binding domain-containing protein [Saccharopolyspora sp. NPDC000359]|uniref:SANT/Myb-like DNA-binding domain-containing protein n=1 Tax=Saccharopolyspora sp. NPDC000359 TaxID=3154251 RepID=UPI00332BA174